MGDNAFDHFYVKSKPTEPKKVTDGELDEIQAEIKRMVEKSRKSKKNGQTEEAKEEAEDSEEGETVEDKKPAETLSPPPTSTAPPAPPAKRLPAEQPLAVVTAQPKLAVPPAQISRIPPRAEPAVYTATTQRRPSRPKSTTSRRSERPQSSSVQTVRKIPTAPNSSNAGKLPSKFANLSEAEIANLWFRQNYPSSQEDSTDSELSAESDTETGGAPKGEGHTALSEDDRLKAWILNGKRDFHKSHKLLLFPRLPTTTRPFNFVAERAEKRLNHTDSPAQIPFKYAHHY